MLPRLIFIILLLLASVGAQAQRFKAMVMGGMNMSQVDGDEVYGYHRFGANAGVGVILPIKSWDVTLETVFNQKGAYQKAIYPADTLTGEYDLRLNYVEVPLLIHYTDKQIITAGVGVSWGRLVYASEEEHSGNDPPYTDSVQFDKNDFNILADIQLRVWRQLKFNVRFAYSLAPIRERYYNPLPGTIEPWSRKQYNHLFTFRLVYVINERYTPRNRQPALE